MPKIVKDKQQSDVYYFEETEQEINTKTKLDEIRKLVKGKSKADFNTIASLRELVFKLLEKENITLE